MTSSNLSWVGAEHVVQTDEAGPLKGYRMTGENWDRRITFTMVVYARSASSAIHYADKWRRDNNKVVANKWTTKPGF